MNERADRLLREYLLKNGLLPESELAVASAVSSARDEPLGRSLLRMEVMSAAVLHRYIEASIGYSLVDPVSHIVDSIALSSIGESFCRQNLCVPLKSSDQGGGVLLAMVEPSNIVVMDAVRQRLGEGSCTPCIADPQAIELALSKNLSMDQRAFSTPLAADATFSLNELLDHAVESSVSDIHIEPTADFARIRLRCDGVLELWRHLILQDWQLLLGRIKVLSSMDIAENRSPQDGRFSHISNGREVDIRAAVLPTDCGEAVVLRILDRNRQALDLDSLGIGALQREQLTLMLQKPEGLLLVCGPTGSGKSTTLYALVETMRGENLNIITLEDPVEYPAVWVRQSSINESVKMDYAAGVRAALRQDPDVLLIGETRDTETAKMSLRAAMTGHRVLTTLHANSALACIDRLWDMGLNPRLLAANLVGVVAQRLLRKLCNDCKEPDSEYQGAYRAAGCDGCNHAGYRGRQAIVEVWPLDPDFDELLHQGASRREFEQLAQSKGLVNLQQAAKNALEAGVTSVCEVERVIGRFDEAVFE